MLLSLCLHIILQFISTFSFDLHNPVSMHVCVCVGGGGNHFFHLRDVVRRLREVRRHTQGSTNSKWPAETRNPVRPPAQGSFLTTT